jgi:hypothetical protein
MPGGVVNNIANLQSNTAITKPYYTLFILVVMMFCILFSQRMLGIDSSYYSIPITLCFIIIFGIIITSTLLHVLKIKDENNYIENFNDTFNSPGSRNFLAIIAFVFFIMFVYEIPDYDNNRPHGLIDKITFGYNNLISNRFVGIILIIIISIFNGYAIYLTTRDGSVMSPTLAND